jgi:hypothetical protein
MMETADFTTAIWMHLWICRSEQSTAKKYRIAICCVGRGNEFYTIARNK